jgi:Tol biopolymer transport system component/imidazolonepropionase-like amidohydrolase
MAACEASATPARQATLTQGTNLAVTTTRANRTQILALHGAIYQKHPDRPVIKGLLDVSMDAWEPHVSRDGKKLVFQSFRNGSFDLYEVELGESEPIPEVLTLSPFDDREPHYSPDGNQILFSSDRSASYEIWLIDADSKAAEQLTKTSGEAHSPAWSNKSQAYAYILQERHGNRIFITNLETNEHVEVFATRNDIKGLAWVPSDSAISFWSLEKTAMGVSTSLNVLNLSTKTTFSVTPHAMDVFPFRANWLTDEEAVFTANGQIQHLDRSGAIHAAEMSVQITLRQPAYTQKKKNFDRSSPKRALGIAHPMISPDGKSVAFSALGNLWVMTLQTEALLQITHDRFADQMPNWSADSQSIVFISDAPGFSQINRIYLESGARQAFDLPYKEISFPTLDNSGRYLAFFTNVPGNPLSHVVGQLTILDLKTGETRKQRSPMPPQPLFWSADSQKILTTKLFPFSRRYREGVYAPIVIDIKAGTYERIKLQESATIASISVSDGAKLAYVQDGQLKTQQLNQSFTPVGAPRIVYAGLANNPTISASGDRIVFQSGKRLMTSTSLSGNPKDVTPNITWITDQPEGTWILRAGRVFTGKTPNYLTDVDIVISGNRIEDIRPWDLATDLPVVDASDGTLVPGLFEAHAHIGDHYLSEAQGRAWLAHGITSVRDPGSNPYLANERKESWASGQRLGPRLFITGFNMDGDRLYYAVSEGITSERHLDLALLRSKELEVDFIKAYVRLPFEFQRRIVEFAHEHGIPVASHSLLAAAINGVDHIEHFAGTTSRSYGEKTSATGLAYQDVLEIIRVTEMGIVPTMVVPGIPQTFQMQPSPYDSAQFKTFHGESARHKYELFMTSLEHGSNKIVESFGDLLRKLAKADALIGVGTDSPFTPFATGLHAELLLYEKAGLERWKILQAATRSSAIVAHAQRDLGTIEVGKLADMIVVSGDPLSRIGDLLNLRYTIKNGRMYSLEELLHPPK